VPNDPSVQNLRAIVLTGSPAQDFQKGKPYKIVKEERD
jgi:hypothetical protein